MLGQQEKAANRQSQSNLQDGAKTHASTRIVDQGTKIIRRQTLEKPVSYEQGSSKSVFQKIKSAWKGLRPKSEASSISTQLNIGIYESTPNLNRHSSLKAPTSTISTPSSIDRMFHTPPTTHQESPTCQPSFGRRLDQYINTDTLDALTPSLPPPRPRLRPPSRPRPRPISTASITDRTSLVRSLERFKRKTSVTDYDPRASYHSAGGQSCISNVSRGSWGTFGDGR
ncbi:hypothetical protein BZG36_03758 [Bifiguratus adelaidae]|uniref:Uncharacterized protein n=1 Tax=Bifiguratus adelaidae TaxID=1938954 RepID=A0A261Y094_9FUNG|nr:hypothetical protein BZG36_03758 [Bifiguratus adelaidae]